MKFNASTEINQLNDLEEIKRFTSIALGQLPSILNNGLTFPDNFDAKLLTIAFSSANVDVATIHGLGRVPSGYIVVGRSAALTVYDGAGTNSTSLLYLRASATGTARVWVI